MINVSTSTVDQLVAAANAEIQRGRLKEAESNFRLALTLQPASAPALRGLGMLLSRTGRQKEAVGTLEKALQLEPEPLTILYLSSLLYGGGHPHIAIDMLRQGAVQFPDRSRIAAELSRALQLQGQTAEAETRFAEAYATWPADTVISYYYGSFLFEIGDVPRAVEVYRKALEFHPEDPQLHSALLFVLHYLPGMTAQTLLEEHKQWNRRHAAPLISHIHPWNNNRDPNRRIKIGYVSPEFRGHPIGRFMAPLIEGHNHKNFQVVAYSDVIHTDDFTRRIERAADLWRPILGMSDEQLADAIRADQIDILVDLTMHMARSRLLAFARKPAPVQLTYLAYCSTTGLSAMDYRLSDPVFDPSGRDDRYTERTIRLPNSWWLYQAPSEAREVMGRQGGSVVFGCLNTLGKVSEDALRLWARIMQQLPTSRLILHAPAGSARERVLNVLAANGVAKERITFADRSSLEAYFALHQQIDIALDPFPYSGGTTTCDALWMGIPVVTLLGDLAISRGSASILTSIDLTDLIAKTPEEYVDIAVRLAEDSTRRADLRLNMRIRMRGSPLMHSENFIAGLEETYRTVWTQWCAGNSGGPPGPGAA